MKTMDQFIYIIVGVVFLTLSFALVNTLVMAIYERTPEIGLLLALGLKPKAILACLSIESMWLITLGMFMGNGLALASLHLMGDGIDLSGVAEGLAMMGASPYLSADLSLHDWAMTNALVFILGLATSVLPARKATQLDPIKALHAS
jgi:ABC-type lipoprotein release transport system permease subunit